jgi:hypothetical protein
MGKRWKKHRASQRKTRKKGGEGEGEIKRREKSSQKQP